MSRPLARLDLLGGVRLRVGPDDQSVPLGRHALALLAVLALAPEGSRPRDRLASLLWADRGEEQARHSLRQCLLTVRRALDEQGSEILFGDGQTIRLDRAAFVIDALELERAVNDGGREALAAAVAQVRGEPLADLLLRSDEFDEWLRSERARLLRLTGAALVRLAELQAEAGEGDAAVATARRLVEIEPLDEAAHRLLMQTMAAAGRRSEALLQYRALVRLLEQELQTRPDAQTEALAEKLRQENGEAPAPTNPLPAAALASPQPAAAAAAPPAAAGEPAPALPAAPAAAATDADRAPDTGAPATAPTAAPAEAAGPPRPASRIDALIAAALPLVERARALRFLRTWAALSGVMVSLMIAIVWVVVDITGTPADRRPEPPVAAAGGDRPSLLVAPFHVLGSGDTTDPVAEALTADITTALTLISSMAVVDHAMAAAAPASMSLADLARHFRVGYVLDGQLQRAGDELRLWVKLVEAASGRQLWARRFRGESGDVFSFQDAITLEIITALQVQITEGEQERIALVHGTRNLEAWLLTGEGQQLLRRLARTDVERARLLYEKAAELDPNYAAAWEGLGWSYLIAARFGWADDPVRYLAQAQALAQRALAIAPGRARTHALIGAVALMGADCTTALAAGERAVQFSPRDTESTALLSLSLSYCGEIERSERLIRSALEHSPYPPAWYRWHLGRVLRLRGRPQEAVSVLAAGIGPDTASLAPVIELLLAYVAAGEIDRARALARAILAQAPSFSAAVWTAAPRYSDPALSAREADLLRAAGVP